MLNSPIYFCLNAPIVNIRLNVLFINGRSYIASAYYSYLSIFSYKCFFDTASVHLGTVRLPGASHGAPEYGKTSPNTFNSATPQTYSIICISSESCLGSIVGFARLPCFGTLRSIISAKVAQGELLRLCPGSSGRAPQYRKPKTDRHDAARAGRCSRGLKILKDFSALGDKLASSDLGVYSAPIRPSGF